MNSVELIKKKRDGGELEPREIGWLVEAYLAGSVADYQMAAWLMAAFIKGLSPRETLALTEALWRSGDTVSIEDPRPKVDKHSTGGVGDKVSLVLAPLVASFGVLVPMVSGRSLGHTGGTLDKLESIPGYDATPPLERFVEIVREVGCSIIGQTDRMAPGDRALYALRDATGTVESVPLIASSITSKKLAEGIDGLVMDVKVGSGAFMKTMEEALGLAETIKNIMEGQGKACSALITDMDQPLGRAVGNRLEVAEAVKALKGEGPPDLREVTVALAEEMLRLAGRPEGRGPVEAKLDSGEAYERWRRMVEAHGGDPDAPEGPDFIQAPIRVDVRASSGGFVKWDAYHAGMAATLLGAGRLRKEDRIDPNAGLIIHKKDGEEVRPGDLVVEVLTSERGRLEAAGQHLEASFRILKSPPPQRPLVHRVLR